MKHFFAICTLAILLISCAEEPKNLSVSGRVKGLKEGTLFLRKMQDSSLIVLDSVQIKGDPTFILTANIDDSQMLYLDLNVNQGNIRENRLPFFASPGEMTINTTLKKFNVKAKISGSENQEKLEEYQKFISRLNDRNLDLIEAHFNAQKDQNDSLINAIKKKQDALIANRYFTCVNFALNNKHLEIAPYLALSEISDANLKYLDTIYNSLTAKIKGTKYGKTLDQLIKERRAQEAKD